MYNERAFAGACGNTSVRERDNQGTDIRMISKTLLDMLACPACDSRPPVHLNTDAAEIVCDACGRRYPIREGIPVMLVDEAVLPVSGPPANGQAKKDA